MKHFNSRARGITVRGYLRAAFAFATVTLLVAISSSSLRAQAVTEPSSGVQQVEPSSREQVEPSFRAQVSPDAVSAGSHAAGVVAVRSVQQRAVSHRFMLFQGDTQASAAPPFTYQVSTPLTEVAVRGRRSTTLAGAAAGLVIGAGATYLLLQQGGSRSFCNRDTNQDAIYARGCHGLYAVGGAVGAGVGALIGYRLGR